MEFDIANATHADTSGGSMPIAVVRMRCIVRCYPTLARVRSQKRLNSRALLVVASR